MADTVYTPDGKTHTILGSTTRVSLIRKYAGKDLAEWVEGLVDEIRQMEDFIDDLCYGD